jgi:UPF0271 protein
MSQKVDLNCDLGELPGAAGLAQELAMLPLVTSINLACGLHAGDPSRIRELAIAAQQLGLAVGAHPSYPDREGFGRQEMNLPANEIRDWVLYQIAAVAGLLKAEGIRLSHIKPHGALYNRAYRDRLVAEAIVDAMLAHDPECVLVGQAGSVLLETGQRLGLVTASEVFGDRGYAADGSLLPRGKAGALISESEKAAQSVLRMVRTSAVELADGSQFGVAVDTICVHGDTPNALEIARRIGEELKQGGVELAAPPARSRLFRVRN